MNGSGHDHEFIGEWIEEFASDADEVEFSGKVAIEEVGDGGDAEAGNGQQAEEWGFKGQEDDDKRDEDDTQHGDAVREVEQIFAYGRDDGFGFRICLFGKLVFWVQFALEQYGTFDVETFENHN